MTATGDRRHRLLWIPIVVLLASSLVTVAGAQFGREAGPLVRVRSPQGGFSLLAPSGWELEHRTPTATNSTYLVGLEGGFFGRLHTAGLWVGRWITEPRTIDGVERNLRESAQGAGTIERVEVAGHPAVRWTHTRTRTGPFATVIPASATLTEYRLLIGPFVYQVGVWAGNPDGREAQFDRIVASLQTFPAAPVRFEVSDAGFALTAPGGWNAYEPTLPGAVLSMAGPDEDWLHVLHYRDDAPAASRDTASRNLTNGGATELRPSDSALGRIPALRLDFRLPDGEGGPVADYTEWFVADESGGTLVLAVGRRDPASTVHESIAASWSAG